MERIKKALIKLFYSLPYIRNLVKKLEFYESHMRVPPGHYYSPIISIDEIKVNENKIFICDQKTLNAINLNFSAQMEWLDKLRNYYNELPFSKDVNKKHLYYYENGFYTYSDAIFLYLIMRYYKPKRIVEVGSGFSSALMLDINEYYFDNQINLTFIEPFPKRLEKLVNNNLHYNLIKHRVQEVDVAIFKELEENDILFIDSSHVVKTGGDVNYLLFNILPILKKGVKIHFHDIGVCFEYPKRIVLESCHSWNEAYFLRAFLMYNNQFEIIAYNSSLIEEYREWFESHMPLCLNIEGGSLWLNKLIN